MNDDVYQIGLSLGDMTAVPMVAYAWFNGPQGPDPIGSIEMVYQLTESGYTLETYVPRVALADIDLNEGGTFGMTISISGTDSAAQGQKVMHSTSAIRTCADPRTFGKITLV